MMIYKMIFLQECNGDQISCDSGYSNEGCWWEKANIIKSIYNLKTHYITPLRDVGRPNAKSVNDFCISRVLLLCKSCFFFCSKFRFGNYCIDSVNSWDNCPGMNIKKKSMRDGTNSFLLQACAAKCATGRPKTGSCFISSIMCALLFFYSATLTTTFTF